MLEKFFPHQKDRTVIPIPLELSSVAGWKEIPIKELGELLVPLGPFSDCDEVFTDSIYFGERNDSPYPPTPPEGGLITMFVRKSVAEQLKKAQKLLPKGMYLVVFDAHRSLKVQQSLFNGYHNPLKEQHPDWAEEQLLTETQKYVSLPSKDPTRPSPHNTGGAVDLAIFQLPEDVNNQVRRIDEQLAKVGKDWRQEYLLEMRKIALIRENAQLLTFGTQFDWGGEEAALNYFERKAQERRLNPNEEETRKNRRLLYHVMAEAGFEPYEDEWWHYNSKKSQMGAKTAGLRRAEFGAATLSNANLEHEQMRKNHWLGSIRILQGWKLRRGKVSFNNLEEYFAVAKQAVEETGDLRKISLPEAAIIAPPRK